MERIAMGDYVYRAAVMNMMMFTPNPKAHP